MLKQKQEIWQFIFLQMSSAISILNSTVYLELQLRKCKWGNITACSNLEASHQIKTRVYTDHADLETRPTKIFYWIVHAFLHNLALYTLTMSSQMGVLLTKIITSASVQINSAALHIIYALSFFFYFSDTPWQGPRKWPDT